MNRADLFLNQPSQWLAFLPRLQVYGDKDADGFYRGETCARLGLIPCNMVSEIQADDEEMMDQLLRQGFLPLNTPVEKIGKRPCPAHLWICRSGGTCLLEGLLAQNNSPGLPWWLNGGASTCPFRGHRFHPSTGKIPHALEQLSSCTTTTEPVPWSPGATATEARAP